MVDLKHLFSPEGPCAAALPGWRARPQQLAMAEAVERAVADRQVLLAEAGTGTGKTLAYLIPALLSGGKVVISTGTKALQDQLFHRDLPAARRALKSPVKVALLKGRANYVCHHHLQRNLADGRFTQRDDAAWLQKIARFAETSSSGDRAEAEGIPEDANAWHYAVSSRDTCLGSECSHFKDCFVMQARKNALDAEVVVVNHHLFFADLWLKDEGVAELLPACNTVVLDEAHQLAETAAQFFGETVSVGQLLDLAGDSKRVAAVKAGDFPALRRAAEDLARAARDLRLVFPQNPLKATAADLARYEKWPDALKHMRAALDDLAKLLETQAERDADLKNCFERAQNVQATLASWQRDDEPDHPRVRWLETTPSSLLLHATPLSVGAMFGAKLTERAQAWVLTSATLAVGGDFTHLKTRLGIEEAATLCVDSPFDYPRQGVLYVPQGLPAPNTPEFTEAVVNAALPVLEISRGRAFILFTSLRALDKARDLLEAAFKFRGWDYPLLVQGEAPKNELLARFQQAGNAVLLGSQSFWEGVDVPGDALSVVIIDKLPFQPPDDPVVAARIAHLEKSGGKPFMDYQLPHAAITLKQGAGRLIRTETDRGVLMICDTRLADKPYGRLLLNALPAMTRTRKLEVVERFFAAERKGRVAAPAGGK
ncbi:ATP-dependent DNA helicase [Thiobacillus sedimenti]|uniref:DNA 5'-3' helicase n=1 Tax=Thiobacillus sedimenti TaxID=3110231 RepID=A0ABZ1CFK2_9PROT|nr:ATP-dependent DNA helicase [Thiobacillus sp. SCUT-2]WRS38017.1 ATP-dependent DNA helicase [Thiobacillus sp. SCUT-2]